MQPRQGRRESRQQPRTEVDGGMFHAPPPFLLLRLLLLLLFLLLLLQTSVLTTILSVFLSSLAGGGLLLQLLLPIFILPFAYISFFLTLFICFITPSLVTPSISHLLLSYFSDSFIVVLFLWNCQRLSWKKLLLLFHLLSPSQCSFVLRLGESLEKPGEA